jgi:putative ABC transport system permease protein
MTLFMRWIYKIPLRIRSLFRKSRAEQDLSDELRFHLEKLTEEYVAKGIAPQEARYAALRELGGMEQIKEECRDMWGLNSIENFLQDLRYGLRLLAKNPGFTAAAVITLALGIGANTTIFSVVWRPMRYRDADRLLMVWERRPDGSRSPVSAPTYLDWRDQNRCFEQLAAARSATVALSGNPPILVSGAGITPNFFDTFRLRPEIGRFFLAAEFRPGGDRVTILSHEIWQTRFGGEAGMVGKAIRLNGETYVVVGVAPADFEFWGRVDAWMPLALTGGELDRQIRDLLVVGRTKPDVTAAGAREEMRTRAARVAQESPQTNKQWSALTQDFKEALAGPGVSLMLVLLFTTVCIVLLMACANVANLLLARGTTRQKEIAVRIALGASRWRVMRQLLVETLLFALMGGALGLLLAFGAVRYLATLPVLQAPGLAPIEINHVVLGFAAALCLAATVLSGLVPAWQTAAANLLEHVKASGRTAVGGRSQNRLRNGFVMAELALSLVLMVTAGLSVRSFIRLAQVDPGFASKGLLTAHLSLPAPQYADAGRVRAFYTELLEGVRTIAGVEDAAISTGLPPMNFEHGQPFRVEGRDPASPATSGVANYQVISAGYFRTLGLTVLKGRGFTKDDREGSTPVVIINHRLAEKFFPASDPLGKRLLISELVPGRNDPSGPLALEIVGIVNDVKNSRVNEPSSPEIYISYLQAPWTSEYLLVRSRSEAEPLVAALRNALRAIDPDLPLTSVSTMKERFSTSLAGGRVVVALMIIFAVMALSMGSVGLYGVISYSVTQRTTEFAVRLALGASHREILRLVANGAVRLLLVGGALGMALALGVARLLGSMIFGVSPYDPVTFTTVALVLLAVVLTASYLPARRATKVDPMVALRYE